MTLDPEALLAGPRGRRVCLEFALSGASGGAVDALELYQAVFYASLRLERPPVIRLTADGPDFDQRGVPSHSVEDVARLLAAVPLAEPVEREMLLCLAEVTRSARYWQEPDGKDILAASPVLREPVSRVAAHLAESVGASWWSAAWDRSQQWVVRFLDPDRTKTESSAAANAFSEAGTEEVLQRWQVSQTDQEKVALRDRPSDPTASYSGTWWSTPDFGLTATTRSLGTLGPAGLWLVEDGLRWQSATATRVQVPPEARVYEIDGPRALAELCRRHPLDVTASRRHDWYRTTGRVGRWVIPDWSRIARDVDAVHLTVAGYLSTAGRAVPVDDDVATVLAGWGPDRTYWLTDVVLDVPSREVWNLDREMWARRAD
ncbi:MAG TPA: hypothetical protein VN133_00580 [Humibacter sp.]|nr:hypothetical protein [Humibacter sp.]